MSKPQKVLLTVGVLLLITIGSLYLTVKNAGGKITTFAQCEKAGWLVHFIIIYDGIGAVEKECVLWSGQRFLKLKE